VFLPALRNGFAFLTQPVQGRRDSVEGIHDKQERGIVMPKKTGRTRERILNCIPSRDTERDWLLDNAVDAGVLDAAPPIPSSIDLREPWWKIGDQGATGSCVGWATADSVLRRHFVKARRLPRNRLLSVRFIWMAAKETDEFAFAATTFIERSGTSLKAALDIARGFGCVTNAVLPFRSGRLYPGKQNTFYALAAQFKITMYINLGRNLNEWRRWLATGGPILSRLDVDETWQNAEDTGGNLDTYKPETAEGGHAVALVGYTPDRFIVRNSWGTDWGSEGFGFASLKYAEAAFSEAYGVVV